MPSTASAWLRVTIPTAGEALEAAAEACLELGAPGVEERDGAVVVHFALPTPDTGPRAEAAADLLTRLDRRLDAVRDAFGPAAVGPVRGDVVADEDWAEGWKRHWRPQAVGRRLMIIPSWLREDGCIQAGRIPLWIDPGMAFGTGDHESTRLALVLLEDAVDRLGSSQPLRVLDVGTGSGILAVAAVRLARERVGGATGTGAPVAVWACDHDPLAARVAAENAAANGAAGAVETVVADILEPGAGPDLPGPADLVLANILLPILDAAAPRLCAALRPGGLIILSGIATSQREELAARYEGLGCLRVTSINRGGWSALLMRRAPRMGR
ncbi:MAG TPA: 50S ribosomal protein L11 methyltransferase [Bacillota bacterium]